MVLTGPKIMDENGKENRFDSKVIERDLKTAGMADCIAALVADRVEEKVQNGWTTRQVWEETDLEINRLEEDIERAHKAYNQTGSSPYETMENENPPVKNRVELTAK